MKNVTIQADRPLPLEAVLCTDHLDERPPRPRNDARLVRGISVLAQTLANDPGSILDKLVEIAAGVCRAGSAGISLLTAQEQQSQTDCPALAAGWESSHGLEVPPRGTCAVVVDRDAVQLLALRDDRGLAGLVEPSREALLAPFYINGKAVGAVWVIARDDRRRFDREDMRQLRTLAEFAAAAYQILQSQKTIRRQDRALREHVQELESLLTQRTDQLAAAANALRGHDRIAMMGTLASGIVHDLSNLLFPLRCRISALRRTEQQPQQIAEHLEAIAGASDYLQKLVSALRGFMADAAAANEPAQPLCAAQWCRETERFYRSILPKSVRLIADAPDTDASSSASGEPLLMIAATKTGLTQAVFNLIQNAANAIGPEREGTIILRVGRIAPSLDQNQDGTQRIIVAVEDDGPGMPSHVRARCMDPFFTTSGGGGDAGFTSGVGVAGGGRGWSAASGSATSNGKGNGHGRLSVANKDRASSSSSAGDGAAPLGLGLSLVRSFVDSSGGSIEVHSPPPGKPHGTAVVLAFPAADVRPC